LAVDVALQPYVVQRFGPSSTEAHDFGYVPRKVTEKSPVTKAKASLLGKATRDARGTMSEKQKRNIKGSLDPATAAAIEALAGSTPPVATSSSPLSPAPTPVVAAPPVAPVVTTSALNGSAHN
jgi:hypothetical protein